MVLWDIDQTLIDGGDVTQHAYAAAFRNATGRPLTQPWRFDGRTELAAATEVLLAHGLQPGGGLLDAFTRQIVAELRARAGDMAAAGRVLPGAAAALAAVRALPSVSQSVLTGNLYTLAVLKLSVFGLDHHVDLRIGAYGGDAYERANLPRHAMERAARLLGRTFTGTDIVIIGDTPRDIAAARAVGARAIAVATGTYSEEDLHQAGAGVVLADLRDMAAILRAITA
jgi:phosphoglycolate phosphatase